MSSFCSRRNLSCFYCNKRSNLKFDGQPSFVCARCDATNWLDERGDIADPPASTLEVQSQQVQYAVPRVSRSSRHAQSLSPVVSDSDEQIFCNTCLDNQRMLAVALQQYEWPEDPKDPEYAARERAYRKFKKTSEERYPQMCSQCEPKVQERLQKASYTAKTDHLRRMMDRTKLRRKETRRRGFLDVVDTAGRWSWHIGFVLQFLWHVSVLCTLVSAEVHEEGDSPLLQAMQSAWLTGLGMLPAPDRVIRWATNVGMCSFPWNPRFKQTIRGFTSHILGFRQWYTYQLVILFIRHVCLFISQYNDSRGMSTLTQLGAHIVVAGLMYYLQKVAGKSIRTDTTPLFGKTKLPRPSQQPPQTVDREEEPNDMRDILDDILQSSPGYASPSSPEAGLSPVQPLRATSPLQNGPFALPRRPQPEVSFGSLNLSDSPPSRQKQYVYQYKEEMDWSPSGSQHRAFSNHNPFKIKNPNPRFSDAPIQEKAGPIWYKVPPAPTNPAHRARNPPQRTVIRESPKDQEVPFFRAPARGAVELGTGPRGDGSGLTLQNPKFHAPLPANDPRDGLSNMMGSFSISPDPEDQAARSRNGGRTSRISASATEVQNNSKVRMAELIVLFGALWSWVTSLSTTETYGPTMALGAICAALMISIRLAADLLVDAQVKEGKQPSVFRLSWTNLGMAQIVAAIALLWAVWSSSGHAVAYGLEGNVLFGVVITHQIWHVFN